MVLKDVSHIANGFQNTISECMILAAPASIIVLHFSKSQDVKLHAEFDRARWVQIGIFMVGLLLISLAPLFCPNSLHLSISASL